MYKFIHPVPVDYMQSFPYNFGSGNKCSRVGIFFFGQRYSTNGNKEKGTSEGKGEKVQPERSSICRIQHCYLNRSC